MKARIQPFDTEPTLSWDVAHSSVAEPRSGQNEDFVLAHDEQGIFVVADGMGGRPNGAQASRLGAETFAASMATYQPEERLHAENIQASVQAANEAIRRAAARDDKLSGMGTTLAALIVQQHMGRVVHIGDSRVYLRRDGQTQCLTQDHTVAGELVSINQIETAEAKTHPLRHMLARSLGGNEKAVADILQVDIRPGDIFLLATDGLHAVLSAADIDKCLQRTKGKRAEHLCGELLRMSRQVGAADDISVLVVQVNEHRSTLTGWRGFLGPSPQPLGQVPVPLPAAAWDATGTNRISTLQADCEKQLQALAAQKRALVDQQEKETAERRKQYLALLDVTDAFERVFANTEARKELWTKQMKIWIGNFKTAYRLLGRLMKNQGVVPIESIDQDFDPRWHEVVCKRYDAEQPEGRIIREVQRGFVWHGELLRRAQVEVTTTAREEGDAVGEEHKTG